VEEEEEGETLYSQLARILDTKTQACAAAENAKENSQDVLQQKEQELAEYTALNEKLQQDVEELQAALRDASQKERSLQQNIMELKLQLEKMDAAFHAEERKRLHSDIKRDKKFLRAGSYSNETISELSWPSTKEPEYTDEAASSRADDDSITLGAEDDNSNPSYENVVQKDWEAASGLKLPVPPLPDVSGMKTTREEELEKDLMQLMAQHMELRKELETQKESMGSFINMISQECSENGKEGKCKHREMVTDLAVENKELKQSLETKSQKHHQVVVRLSKSINRTSRLERILKSRDSMVKTLEGTVQQMQRDLRATLEENQRRERKLNERLEWFNAMYPGKPEEAGGSTPVIPPTSARRQGSFYKFSASIPGTGKKRTTSFSVGWIQR